MRYLVYDETIDYMNDNYPFMTTYVLQMGRPIDDNLFPLAFVAWDDLKGLPEFHLNVQEVTTLGAEERCFVFFHETFHVLLNHNKLDFPDKKKSNIAADVVINDYLVYCGLQKFDGLLYGENTIGFDSFGLTVKEVYDLLPPDPPAPQGDSPLAQKMQGDGTCGSDHTHNHADQFPQDFLDAAPQELKDASEKESKQHGASAGSGHTDLQAWAEQQKVELAWAELLKKLKPSAFETRKGTRRRMTFNSVPRKIAYAAPEILLPVFRDTKEEGLDEGKTVRLTLAIDTSGSISDSTRDRFFRIARSIPQDKIELRVVGFADYTYEIDLNRVRFSSGGTNFQSVEDWIKAEYPVYPDGVFVFTDAKSRFHKIPDHIDRWHWFLCDRADVSAAYVGAAVKKQSATWDNLERFVR